MHVVYVAYQQTTPNTKPFPIAMFTNEFDCEDFINSLYGDLYSLQRVKCKDYPFDFVKP